MPNYLSRLSKVAVLTACLATPLWAQDTPTADTVVATVNGTDITLGHMILARSGLPQQYDQLPPEVLWQGILDQLISQTLLSTDETAQETTRVRKALDNERRALLAGEAAQTIAMGALSDEALQAAYDAEYGNIDLGFEYNASHILVPTEEEAQAIIAELEGGAEFAVVAREKSTGPSGPNGGALNWFGPGMMVPEFETAVAELEVEAISAPVQTQFGWHVIRLNDKRQKAAPTLDEVRDQLTQQIQQTAIETRIEDLTAKAEIDRSGAEGVDPALLTQMNLLEN